MIRALALEEVLQNHQNRNKYFLKNPLKNRTTQIKARYKTYKKPLLNVLQKFKGNLRKKIIKEKLGMPTTNFLFLPTFN